MSDRCSGRSRPRKTEGGKTRGAAQSTLLNACGAGAFRHWPSRFSEGRAPGRTRPWGPRWLVPSPAARLFPFFPPKEQRKQSAWRGKWSVKSRVGGAVAGSGSSKLRCTGGAPFRGRGRGLVLGGRHRTWYVLVQWGQVYAASRWRRQLQVGHRLSSQRYRRTPRALSSAVCFVLRLSSFPPLRLPGSTSSRKTSRAQQQSTLLNACFLRFPPWSESFCQSASW